MYLKSLNIKGFKSFADKVTLAMEPGITAIVGPNGSGKSNISDAILWVLGERNARHLRGQAMEDVIFAGSSQRRPTALAEVELLLDNGDKTLPMDYTEVSIARRIYRSGESEYLINGSIVRRRDIHDLLNDCGLGANVHSIISQGSLEEILQSSPAQRQAMVEEAAGLLKHKQRRERATRKLETLRHHLVRVRDIASMLKSQLRPLARKAERFERYTALKHELDATLLALAVDDLRTLHASSESLEAQEQRLDELLESQRDALADSDAAMESLQRQMRQKDDDTAARSRLARRFGTAGESLGGLGLVIQERKRSNLSHQEDLQRRKASSADQRITAQRRLQRTQDDLKQLELDCAVAQASLGELKGARDDARSRLASLETQAAQRAQALQEQEDGLAAVRNRLSGLNETLNEARVRIAFVENQESDVRTSLANAVTEAETLAAQVTAAGASLDELLAQEAALADMIAANTEQRDAAREALDDARRQQAALDSRHQIAQDRQKAWLSASGAARNWLESKRTALNGHLEALGDTIEVDPGFESLVELALGFDGAAMLVDQPSDITSIATGLSDADADGAVSLVLRSDPSALPSAVSGHNRLIDHVHTDPTNERAVASLLGDVVICDTLAAALAAHDAAGLNLRFITKAGAIVWPTGKVTLGVAAEASGEGPIQLKSALRTLERERAACGRRVEAATAALDDAEAALRLKEADRRAMGESLADMRGRVATAQSQADAAQATLEKLRDQLNDLSAERTRAEASIESTKPAIDQTIAEEAAYLSRIEELKASGEELTVALAPLRNESTTLNEKLSEQTALQATLSERRSHLQAAVAQAKRTLTEIDEEAAAFEAEMAALQSEAATYDELAARFEALQAWAVRDGQRLEALDLEVQAKSHRLHDQWASARDASEQLHAAYDQTLTSIADVRVERGRLDASVAQIVERITDELGVALEEAIQLEPLKDRASAEQERDRLQESIRKLGVTSPDAIDEYRQLSERYEYVGQQLNDLEEADQALRSITEVIDRRMTLDFERTFEAVRTNFLEIFGQLFPGGSAELRLLEGEAGEELPGIEVVAQPRGKRITKMTLMSGGEKSLTALALLFAIYQVRHAPFYLLDEVEAALDDSNLRRLLGFLEHFAEATQLIMITHQRSTMEMADVLFGVTMQSDGVTRVVSQRLQKREDGDRGIL